VVYSPHCFKFDDPAASNLLRRLARGAESVLSRATSAFAVLSEHELSLARSLGAEAELIYIPNIPSVPARSEEGSPAAPDSRKVVSMVGRIAPQKGPDFFIAVKQATTTAEQLEWLWIGDGDAKWRCKLESAGVQVTGWLRGSDLVAQLDRTSLYLHTAEYEGFPLSVLDAAARRVAIVARAIPALTATPLTTVATPQEASDLIAAVLEDRNALSVLADNGDRMLERMNADNQRRALLRAWAVTERAPEPCPA